MATTHPYFPRDLELDGYVPLVVDFTYILGVFFSAVTCIAAVVWKVSGNHKHLTRQERALACWFMVTGVIHFVVEGWVVAKPGFFQDASGNYLSDTWKEYSKADSRYASRDSFIISMEAITAFVWGPLCPLVVYGIFARSAWRYTLMVIVSLGQIYGDVLYYGTCFLEGFVHSRPEALYFWLYFVIINAFWIIIPSAVIVHAWARISAAVGTGPAAGKKKGKKA